MRSMPRGRPCRGVDGAASPEDARANAASQRVLRAPDRDDPPGVSRLADPAQRTPPPTNPSRVGHPLQPGPSACQFGTGNPRGISRRKLAGCRRAITSPRDAEWSRRPFSVGCIMSIAGCQRPRDGRINFAEHSRFTASIPHRRRVWVSDSDNRSPSLAQCHGLGHAVPVASGLHRFAA